MTSLRSVGAAIILVPASLAAFTLIPRPQHHPQPVSSPTTGAVVPSPHRILNPTPTPDPTPTRSMSPSLPRVWPSSTVHPAATPAPLSPDITSAALAFTRGWLTRDPAARKIALVQIAAPTLMGSLMATKPPQIPATTVAGPPTLAGSAADGPLIDVPLADHTVVHLTLVPEPTAATGWLVTSIKH